MKPTKVLEMLDDLEERISTETSGDWTARELAEALIRTEWVTSNPYETQD